MSDCESGGLDRRGFLGRVALAGAAAPFLNLRTAHAQSAAAGRVFKVALVGCGGRGRGAAGDCRAAAKALGGDIQVVAVADFFAQRAAEAGRQFNVPEAAWHHGADAYRKAIESDAEIVINATPPLFRPLHFEAAVAAGKHQFIEKPVAVDPPGIRRMRAAGADAAKKGLAVVAGTQRRHEAPYQRIAGAVRDGALGRILGGQVYWCGDALWFKTREAHEADASYLVRNWTSFAALSGDHIVEQHVHNLDVANWFLGRTPATAIGFGGRARRKTGDQFDFFSIDFDYGEDCHIHSMCRQVSGSYGRIAEFFTGQHGFTGGSGNLRRFDGAAVTLPDVKVTNGNPYVEEHVVLLRSILEEKPAQETETVCDATLAAIMGRIAAYTGQIVRWSDVATRQDSALYNLTLNPTAESFEDGSVKAPPDDVIPIPGRA